MKSVRVLISVSFSAVTLLVAGSPPPFPLSTANAEEDSSSSAGGAPSLGDEFWSTWGDGQAEVCGYDLTISRYGETRRGSAVAIFVTETFSNEARVKADPGKHDKSDEFPVMKLNLVQDFTTGVYDYNLMTSAFVALAPVNGMPAGAPTKISFSCQDWCGHVYEQALFDAKGVRLTAHSYFDGEADVSRSLAHKEDAVAEDALFLWARGFAGPYLQPGEWKKVPMLPSAQSARLTHVPLKWTLAILTRLAKPRPVTVPAGVIDCETWTAEIEGPGGGHTWAIDVEKAPPHRIVRWEMSRGEKGELLAGERMKYWEMNSFRFRDEVKKLGLEPRPPRTM